MRRSALWISALSVGFLALGCEEKKEEVAPEANVGANTGAAEKPGAITSFRNQGVGSAPGNARRSAENTLNKATQRQAEQFGEIFGDD